MALSYILILTLLIVICRAESSTNDTVDENSSRKCERLIDCTTSKPESLAPIGDFFKSGVYFSSDYVLRVCNFAGQLVKCSKQSSLLNDPVCSGTRLPKLMSYVQNTYSKFCCGNGLEELEMLRTCMNEREMQLHAFKVMNRFVGELDAFGELRESLNGTVQFTKDMVSEFICRSVLKFARKLYQYVVYSCGSDTANAFRKIGPSILIMLTTVEDIVECPTESTMIDMPENRGRGRRSDVDPIFSQFMK